MVELECSLQNITDRDIRGMQGYLVALDSSGVEIADLDYDFTGKLIAPNEIIMASDIKLYINMYRAGHKKLFNDYMPEFTFRYNVRDIKYGDFRPPDIDTDIATTNTTKLSVEVTNRSRVDANPGRGQEYPMVQFEFTLTNNTDKIIPANNSKKETGLGVHIKIPMIGHEKPFKEKYEDITFYYEVLTIVYSDGQL